MVSVEGQKKRLNDSIKVSLACTLIVATFFRYFSFHLDPSPTALNVFMVGLNVYEVITHTLVFFKFLGFRNVAYGAQEDQSILGFTLHNFLDMLAFVSYMIVTGNNSWMYTLLLGGHVGSNVLALTDPYIFQEFYIKNNPTNIPFRVFKTAFVVSDAVAKVVGLYGYLV